MNQKCLIDEKEEKTHQPSHSHHNPGWWGESLEERGHNILGLMQRPHHHWAFGNRR